jgi:hypothetical protein
MELKEYEVVTHNGQLFTVIADDFAGDSESVDFFIDGESVAFFAHNGDISVVEVLGYGQDDEDDDLDDEDEEEFDLDEDSDDYDEFTHLVEAANCDGCKEGFAAAFDEWQERSNNFGTSDFEGYKKFLAESNDGVVPTYGQAATEYLFSILSDLQYV